MHDIKKGLSLTTSTTPRTRRSLALAISVGIAATILAAISFLPASSGFTASINNTSNTVGTGTLVMKEDMYGMTCLSTTEGKITVPNTGECGDIAGELNAVPGHVLETSLAIENAGTLTANSFTLTPGGCKAFKQSVGGNGLDTFCSKVDIAIQDNTADDQVNCVYPKGPGVCPALSNEYNLETLGKQPLPLVAPVKPGESRYYTFYIKIDESATNDHQGLYVNEPLLWTFAV